MYRYQQLSKNASVEVIEGAAHMTMIDEPERLAEVVSDFLKKVESN